MRFKLNIYCYTYCLAVYYMGSRTVYRRYNLHHRKYNQLQATYYCFRSDGKNVWKE